MAGSARPCYEDGSLVTALNTALLDWISWKYVLLGSNMFCMSENEKAEQIGKLAEEYSAARGHLNHVQERLTRFWSEIVPLANQQIFQTLRVDDGVIKFNPAPPYQRQTAHSSLEGLLDHKQLKEVLEEKQRLAEEISKLAERLKALAPHLL